MAYLHYMYLFLFTSFHKCASITVVSALGHHSSKARKTPLLVHVCMSLLSVHFLDSPVATCIAWHL